MTSKSMLKTFNLKFANLIKRRFYLILTIKSIFWLNFVEARRFGGGFGATLEKSSARFAPLKAEST
ncbi:hypothetical protein BKN38_08945 [Helicobacter sp. CLO-3]|nr:hypothetical protein BA723_07880 [Helicobacter sp. CLO-3]OHU81488.1 hypothetical protein BKN38_08945 [Helicobacter sp. CLO-3]